MSYYSDELQKMRDRITALETKILIRDQEIKKLKEGGSSEKVKYLEVLTDTFDMGKFALNDITWGHTLRANETEMLINAVIHIYKLETEDNEIPF